MITSVIIALLFDFLKILIGNTPCEYFYVAEIFVANFAFFYYYIIFFYNYQYGKTNTRSPHINLEPKQLEASSKSEVRPGAARPYFGKKFAHRPRSKQLEKFAIWGHGRGIGSCRWLATRQYSTLPHICQY